MAVTNTPIHVQAVKHGGVIISTANTNRDGTGTLGDLLSGGTNGTRVQKLRAKANVTTTGGMVRFFHHDGTTYRLIYELIVVAITAAASVKTWEDEIYFPEGYFVPSGHKISVSTHNAESISVHSDHADY